MSERVVELATRLGADAFLVSMNGGDIIHLGNTRDLFNVASIRKCFLSALYGIRLGEGAINMKSTLEDLGIDDSPPKLSHDEKQATIEDLLTLSSGVYHPANYETASEKANKPLRGSHHHGTFWHYNNWDANALGTIYRRTIRRDIFEDFRDLIAEPIGMEDFRLDRCEYKEPDSNSTHPAYVFFMSSRDLLKFVQLYLRQGNWNGRQIIPTDWIRRSLTSYFATPDGNGYGYMWEIAIDGKLYRVQVGNGAFAYSGYPGHYIVGIPDQNLALVYRHTYDLEGRETLPADKFSQLLRSVVVLADQR